jgi:cytochrome c biogenesis protein
VGVVASFMVRRRRVWVRASAGEGGRTVVEVGGLTLGNPTSEFDDIVAALRGEQDKPGTDQAEPGKSETGESGTDQAGTGQAAAPATESEE